METRVRLPNIAEIDHNVFLGNQTATQATLLETLKIQHVFHIGFTISDFSPNVQYEFIELEDNSFSAQTMLAIGKELVSKINQCLANGEKVLVCCVMGRSRSASMIMMWLHSRYLNLTYDEAIAKIKEVRTISINQTFADVLREYWKS